MVIFHSYAMLVYQRVKSIESQSLKDFLFLFPNKKDDWWHNDFWCPPTHMFFVLHVVSVRIHPNIEHCNAFSQWCIRIKDLNRRKFMTNAGSVGWWTPNCFAEGNSDCRLYPNTRNGGKTGEKGTVKWPFSWDQFPFLWLSFTYEKGRNDHHGRQDSLISRVAIHLLWDIYCSFWIPMMYHPANLFSGDIPFISISWVLCLIFSSFPKTSCVKLSKWTPVFFPQTPISGSPPGNLWNMSWRRAITATNLKTVPW